MLNPEDVAPEAARRVLEFLNAARSAEEIAAAVELAGERDVGVRVAQRILDRRRELGGFTDLRQVAAVPLVGPERFEEIVTTLSARAGYGPVGLVPPQVDLRREVRAMWTMVEALQSTIGGRARVTLRALQDRPWLGQTINLVAAVTDAGGTPQVDVPVTFATTWGRLRAVEGLATREGTSVVARTGGDGGARVRLRPPTDELRTEQQDSLEVALRGLDPTAGTPRDALAGLQELARQYRRDGNGALRRAIDVYVRDLGPRRLDDDDAPDPLLAWANRDATVLAYARDAAAPQAEATAVQAAAALTIPLKDWIGPWLATFRALTEAQSRLADDLLDARRRGGEPGALLGRVYGRVRDFVDDQPGLIGQQFGRAIAERTLRDFLDTGLADFPLETRVALFPALEVATGAITTAGPSVLAAVGQARVDLHREFQTKVGRIETGVLGTLTARLDEFEVRLADKLDTSLFAEFQGSFDARLATKVDTAAFTTFQGQLDTGLAGIRDELGVLRSDSTRLDQAVTGLNTTVTRLDRDVATKVDTATFTTFQGQVSVGLAAKADASALTGVRGDVDALRSVSTRLDKAVTGLNTTVTRLDRDVTELKRTPRRS